jgi:hypothetical protein
MPHIAFAAAYLDSESNDLITSLGFQREDFHLTTCIDMSGNITEMPVYGFQPKTAVVKAVTEWPVRGGVFLVAELVECEWSSYINKILKAYGAVEDVPHNPHITLLKTNAEGTSHLYQSLVGVTFKFNRHVIKRKDIP